MSSSQYYRIIGLMSGTSLDGLDVVMAEFELSDGKWKFSIKYSKTIKYPEDLELRLRNATVNSALEISLLHVNLGKHFAKEVNSFIDENDLNKTEIDCIASHGHTIFHQPELGMTLQIGCGQTIASLTGIKVVNNFREKDVVLGGQGAPLVPIGDALLLKDQAEAYLNLGGFANISIPSKNMLAFDICPANIILNQIVKERNFDFDDNGSLGKSCTLNQNLLKTLNSLDYYSEKAPKSLGVEWLNKEFLPCLKSYSFEERLASCYAHISDMIARELNKHQVKSVMITGGGAKNSFLMAKIKEKFSGNIQVPESELIDFKEALIFAFLGLLKLRNEVNCLKAVTGAKKDNVGGNIYEP